MAINKNKVIASAQKYAEKGAYDKAITEYLKVVNEEPDDVRTWHKVADLYAKKGARSEAINTYLKVAEFFANQGFYLKSVAVYKQILKLDPTVVQVNLRLAELYQQLGLLSDAQNQYEHVAGFYQRAGRTHEALDVMQRLVELDPDNVPSRIKLAELYSKENLKNDAVREFGVAADRLREQGRIDDFIKVAERLLWHKPDEVALGRELASVYLERKDLKRALAKLQQCFQGDPKDVDTLALLAQAFQTIGQLPKTISVYREMARIFAERGDEERRFETLRAIHAIAPDDPEANQVLFGGAPQQPRPLAPEPVVAAPAPPPPQPAPPDMVQQDPYELVQPIAAAPPPPQYSDPQPTYQDVLPPEEEDIELGATLDGTALDGPALDGPALDGAVLDDFDGTVLDGTALDGTALDGPALDGGEHPTYLDEPDAFEVDDDLVVEEMDEVEELIVVDGPQEKGTEIGRLLTETDVFVKYGLHDKAIEHLQKIFELEPLHIEAREKLKDIYIQMGETARAIAELMYLSDLYVESNAQASVYYLQEALNVSPGHPDVVARMQNLGVEVPQEVADPFAAEEGYGDLGGQAVLTSANEDYSEQHQEGLHHQQAPFEGATPSQEVFEESTVETPSTDEVFAQPIEAAPAGSRVDEELEEVDFFLQQGLMDEAKAMLTDLARNYPGNALVMEKLAEIDGDQARRALLDESFTEDSFELDPALLNDTIGANESDVKDVFEQFKQGVAQQVDAGDADTHFDLGVAYKEMGLLDDAIAEFEIARENPDREAISQTMIGHCHVQAGKFTDAINAFKRGLYAERKSTTEELDLYYELGNAYLALDDPSESLYYLQKVAKRSPDYRNVKAQIAALKATLAEAAE